MQSNEVAWLIVFGVYLGLGLLMLFPIFVAFIYYIRRGTLFAVLNVRNGILDIKGVANEKNKIDRHRTGRRRISKIQGSLRLIRENRKRVHRGYDTR